MTDSHNGSNNKQKNKPKLASVSYCSYDDAIDAVLRLGKGALMCKTDIESAFRIIPVHPSDHKLLGYKWQSRYYFDSCLPFGCRSSPARTSDTLIGYLPIFQMLPKTSLCTRYHWYSFEEDA